MGDVPSASLRGEVSQAAGGGPGVRTPVDRVGEGGPPVLGTTEAALRPPKAGKGQSSGEYSSKGWSCARTFLCVP